MDVKMIVFGRSRSSRWVFLRNLTRGLARARSGGRSVALRELGGDLN